MIIDKKFFNPKDTFECGQCFRWRPYQKGYLGVVHGSLLWVVEKNDASYEVRVLSGQVSEDVLHHYFDCDAPYQQIFETLVDKDQWLQKAATYGKGIRLLNQEPFEMLMTFIISANNNIPKIRMAVEALSEKFGTYITSVEGQEFYAFPTLEQLRGARAGSLNVKGMGYRAKSLEKAIDQLSRGEVDLTLSSQESYELAQERLKQVYGVGNKVADCVLLFAYGHKNAFPVDTWMRKVLETLYGIGGGQREKEAFAKSYFTEYGGYAQQYLFYYMRTQK